MTWICDVQSFGPSGSGVAVAAVLSNGVQKFQQSFQTNGTQKDLKAQVLALTSARDQVLTKGDLVLGPLDLTPDVVVVTPIDPALVQFQADLSALRRENRALADGLKTGQDITALRASVQSAIDKHPDYLGLL